MNRYDPVRQGLLGLAIAFGSASAEPEFLSDATVTPNPNPRAPLVALLNFEAKSATGVRVQISNADRSQTIHFDRLPAPEDPLVLLGFRAGQKHQIKVTLVDDSADETTWPGDLGFAAPPLPADRYLVPDFSVNVSQPQRMEPGITLLSIRRALLMRPQDRSPEQNRFVMGYGLLLALDEEGEVVWFYQTDDRIAGIDQLRNGNIIFHQASFQTAEMDWQGNILRTWYAEKRPGGPSTDPDAIPIQGMQTLHHQPHEVRDGSFLSFSANSKLIKDWYTNEYDPVPRKDQKVMGDTIIEFSKSGEILWTWNAFDYLDVFQIGYEAFNPYWVTRGFPDTWDWTHGNGVSYDPRDDSVVASFKLLDGIVKIDRKTKDIKWIFADPIGWLGPTRDKLLTPVGDDFRWPWHQHNPRWTHAGTLLVFNNNRAQARPFDGRPHAAFKDTYSYSAEYEIDEEAGTVRQVWISEPELTPEACSSWAMSETHRLPTTDNMLEIHALCMPLTDQPVAWDPWDRSARFVSSLPHGGRVREYTRTAPAEVVFEVSFNDRHQALGWQVYGGFRTQFYRGANHH